MYGKKILYFSHNTFRDLSPDTILAHELKSLGNLVWMNTFLQEDGQKVCHIKPDIVILPEIRNEHSELFAKQCGFYGIKVVVKMCEFGISEESLSLIHPDYKEAIFGTLPTDPIVDLFIAWGPKMKSMMVEHMKLPPCKIADVGALQFDPYFLPPPPITMKTGDKKVILFAAGFPYADRNPDYCMPEAKSSSPIHSIFVEKDAKQRAKWLEFLPKFAEKYADTWEIIAKIHPGEKRTGYDSVLRGLPIRVVDNVSGLAAMQGIDFLVHAGSTMGYEAHLKNIPSINFCNNCEDIVVSQVSPNCDTADDFYALFESILAREKGGSTAPDEILAMLKGYYGEADGLGCKRAAVAIDKLSVGPTQIPDVWSFPREFKYQTSGVVQYVEQWYCGGCKNHYFLIEQRREMVKCPFCGIANVKIMTKTT